MADHAEHDPLLVAALADRELRADEADRARSQVATCAECAALHADLVSLATATRALPPVPRPRDFTLRPVDAQRLRPGLVRRILGSFGTARDGFSRPLAMGLTTLGLAGLLIGVVPGAVPGGGPAATLQAVGQGAGEDVGPMSAASEAPAAPGALPAAPAASGIDGYDGGSEGAPGDPAAPTSQIERDLGNAGRGSGGLDLAAEPDPEVALAPDSSGVSQLVVISGSLLILGLGLFALRWTSRRFGG